jgi:hypothetical protein
MQDKKKILLDKILARLIVGIVLIVVYFFLPTIILAGSAMYQRCQPGLDCIIGEYVFDNEEVPIERSICTIDIRNPSGTLIVNAAVMTAETDGWHSYTVNVTTPEGLYRALMRCEDDGDVGYLNRSFEVGTSFDSIDEQVWGSSSRTLSSFGSLASDVWNALTKSFSTTGSIGRLLSRNVDTTVSSRSSHSVDDVVEDIDLETSVADSFETLLDYKLASIQLLSSINNQLLEQLINSPQIKVWYEKGSILLKVEITNPSEVVTQTVQLRQNLPREIRPEHIISLDGLEIDYDTTLELYYLHGEYELAEKETIEKVVKINNIWEISETEITGLYEKTDQAVALLNESAYFAQGMVLANEIKADLNTILEKQSKAVTPDEYIIVYRENITTLEKTKKNFEVLHNLMIAWEGEKKVVANIGGIQITSTWGIMVAVIFGIFVLGVVNLRVYGRGKALVAAITAGGQVQGGTFGRVNLLLVYLSIFSLALIGGMLLALFVL